MVIKATASMNSAGISRFYKIHEDVYLRKGIGHPYATWKENLTKSYHGGPEKIVLEFDRDGLGAGYIISTRNLDIDGCRYSKMLECAATPMKWKDGKLCFTEMQKGFLSEMAGDTDVIFGENGKDYKRVLEIFENLGFHRLRNPAMAEALLTKYLRDVDFTLNSDESGFLVVNRKTGVDPDYHGYILMREV
jgi:hypothetical protein